MKIYIYILFFSFLFSSEWVKTLYKENQLSVVRVNNFNNGEIIGHGTGFIIDESGIVVTNYHVVSGAAKVEVITIEDEIYNVDGFFSYDSIKDYAIMKIPGFDMPALKLGNSKKISIGEEIVAIGNPLGLDNTISKGIISQIRKLPGYKMIQIDADIAPGSSGGPLFIKDGSVIGVTTSGIGGENLNFALPINYIRGELSKTEIVYPGDYFSTFKINKDTKSNSSNLKDISIKNSSAFEMKIIDIIDNLEMKKNKHSSIYQNINSTHYYKILKFLPEQIEIDEILYLYYRKGWGVGGFMLLTKDYFIFQDWTEMDKTECKETPCKILLNKDSFFYTENNFWGMQIFSGKFKSKFVYQFDGLDGHDKKRFVEFFGSLSQLSN